uniref:Uncharacterized protein n=2 Tax=Auxenochlorella protothecoides TaxID=3075 RepID=A0A1D2AF40_AUXPR
MGQLSDRGVGSPLPPAPVFHPSPEEWTDPAAYIASVVRPLTEGLVGLAKIRPPACWPRAPPIDPASLQLCSQLQAVARLQHKTTEGVARIWRDSYADFCLARGQRPGRNPVVAGHEVDLHDLFTRVTAAGGWNSVEQDCRWGEIAACLEIDASLGVPALGLRSAYENLLLAYENVTLRGDEGDACLRVAGLDDGSDAEDAHGVENDGGGEIDATAAAEVLGALLGTTPASGAKAVGTKKIISAGEAVEEPSPSPSLSADTSGGKVPQNIFTMVCEACRGGHAEDRIILCDRCDKGWHLQCLEPPLSSVPVGDWICPSCILEEVSKSAFKAGKSLTLLEFEAAARKFEAAWFGRGGKQERPPHEVEAAFWGIVEGGTERVEVLHGSTDPTALSQEASDLRTLCDLGPGSILACMDEAERATLAPRLEAGMVFSSSCWSAHPDLLYSLSYLKSGAPKIWYGVPAAAAGAFEEAFRALQPAACACCPGLVDAALCMPSPRQLVARGVPVARLTQDPGEVVVTLPMAYAASLSCGTNLSETAALATPDSLRYAAARLQRCRRLRRPTSWPHELVLLKWAEDPALPASACPWLARELRRCIDDDLATRLAVWAAGTTDSRRAEGEAARCALCGAHCTLSALECPRCAPGRQVCAAHVAALCECEPARLRLAFRHTTRELEGVVGRVAGRAADEGNGAVEAGFAGADAAQSGEDTAAQEEGEGEEDDLVGLAGFMTELAGAAGGGREGGCPDPASASTASTPAPPPTIPTPSLAPPGAAAALQERLARLGEAHALWRERCEATLARGGRLAADLDELLEEGKQYAWGAVDDENGVEATFVHLREAAAYLARVEAALASRPAAEELEGILGLDPPPLAAAPGLERLQELGERAREWRARTQAAMAARGSMEMKDMEALISDGAAISVIMPEVRLLRERLAAARKLGESIRTALPGLAGGPRRRKGEAETTLEGLQALRAAAVTLRCDVPFYPVLCFALDRLEAWAGRVKQLLGMRAPLADLRALIEESRELPAAMPEVETVESLIAKGLAWQSSMHALVAARAPLKRMRDALHAGLRLPVELPEVEELRGIIRRREWEDAARRALNNRNSLHALHEVDGQAEDVGAGDCELAVRLREKIAAAEAWDREAAAFLEAAQAPGLGEDQRPDRGPLAAMVERGSALGVKLERGSALQGALLAAEGWLARARRWLPEPAGESRGGATAGGKTPGKAEAESVAEKEGSPAPAEASAGEQGDAAPEAITAGAGADMPLDGSAPAPSADDEAVTQAQPGSMGATMEEAAPPSTANSGRRSSKRSSGDGAGAHAGPRSPVGAVEGGRMPTLATIRGLLAEYEGLLIRADEAKGLAALQQHAEAWLQAAWPMLQLESVGDAQLEELQALLAAGAGIHVEMEERDHLLAQAKGLIWNRQAREVLARLQSTERGAEHSSGGNADVDEFHLPTTLGQAPLDERVRSSADASTSAPSADEPPSLPGKTSSVERPAAMAPNVHSEGPCEPGAETDLSNAGQYVKPEPMQGDADAASGDGVGPPEALPAARVPLEVGVALMQGAADIPVEQNLFSELERHVNVGLRWQEQAQAVLAIGRPGSGDAAPVEAGALQRMLAEGAGLGFLQAHLVELEAVLRDHQAWEGRVLALRDACGNSRPCHADLAKLGDEAAASPVTSLLRRHIEAAVLAADDWVARCRRSTVKRNSVLTLASTFETIGSSVDAAVEQFERRLELEKQLVATGGAEPEGSDEGGELYCLCQQTYEADTSMIMCDSCGEWFHMRCVGISQTQAKVTKKYTCPVCAAVRYNGEPLQAALAKLKKTRRPTRAGLGAFLEQARGLPVSLAEEEDLEKVLVKFDRWATATNRAVEVHAASRLVETGGQILPLSEGMLHQLCKSALAMELDASEFAERILSLLRCNRWRTQVEALWSASSAEKPTMEAATRLLAEAARCGVVSETDIVGFRLAAAAAQCRDWQRRAKAVLAHLQPSSPAEGFEAAAAAAAALTLEAERLPLGVPGEAEDLAERGKLYCLCRAPYDEQRPMLGCDHCSDWYHYECVGLPGPAGEEGAGAEAVPEDFRCPSCALRAGVTYPAFHGLPPRSVEALRLAALGLGGGQGKGDGQGAAAAAEGDVAAAWQAAMAAALAGGGEADAALGPGMREMLAACPPGLAGAMFGGCWPGSVAAAGGEVDAAEPAAKRPRSDSGVQGDLGALGPSSDAGGPSATVELSAGTQDPELADGCARNAEQGSMSAIPLQEAGPAGTDTQDTTSMPVPVPEAPRKL